MSTTSYSSILKVALVVILSAISTQVSLRAEERTLTRTIRLAPSEYFAIRYDAKRGEFVSEEPTRSYEGLSLKTQKQILRVPFWIREMLADRLVDLYYDDIDVGDNAAPTFFDINDDGSEDLIAGNAQGEIQCFLGPFFKTDKEIFKHVQVSGNAVPCFHDLNRDGDSELYVGDALGGLTVWEGKGWRKKRTLYKNPPFSGQVHPISCHDIGLVVGDETGRVWSITKSGKFHLVKAIEAGNNGSFTPWFETYGSRAYLRGSKEGTISYCLQKELPCEYQLSIQNLRVLGNSCPILHDVDHDNVPDIVIGSADGCLRFFINRGTGIEPRFATYPREFEKKFPLDVGYLSSPRIADIDYDGFPDLVTGAKDGVVRISKGPRFDEKSVLSDSLCFSGAVLPAPGDFDGDGNIDLICGLEDGTILICKGPEFVNKQRIGKVHSCAAPYAADLDSDGKCDLIVGSGDGRIVLFYNNAGSLEEKPDFFQEIKAGEYPCPAVVDMNNDGKLDVVTGNREGPIRVFLAPDWKECKENFGIGAKETFTVPGFGDLTGDGNPELVLGGLNGTFLYFEKEEGWWVEKQSWQFEASRELLDVTDYFTRCHPESELLRGMIDTLNIAAFTEVLAKAEDKYLDETAFALAAMPTEVLRSMGRMDNADILLENARCIYEMADKVKYAKIIEKQDYTTIEYICEGGIRFEMPRDVYYWWLVHPRLYYEVPLRVDPSYWEHDNKYYGITQDQWTEKEIELENMGSGSKCEFWRSYFVHDNKYGKTLLDVIQPAETVEEAIYLMGDWLSQNMPSSWYVYGRNSTDPQPMVIYQKHYGSCGESSMLCAAFSRTMLVANGCSGCGGEDHVWNEFWLKDKWYAWDLIQPSDRIRYPWYCCEGPEHSGTQIIAVTRPRGDDLVEARTTAIDQPEGCNSTKSGKGYTDAAQVTIQIMDSDSRPVEGAAIIVRSDCLDSWRTSIWGYTDPNGLCYLELGKPQKRCMLDIISQQGITGTSHLSIEENQAYFLKYILPGKFNAPVFQLKEMQGVLGEEGKTGTLKINTRIIEELQYPRNLETAKHESKTITEFMKKTGYSGTRNAPYLNYKHNGLAFIQLNQDEYNQFRANRRSHETYRMIDTTLILPFMQTNDDVYLFYNPNRFTSVCFSLTVSTNIPSSKPEIWLTSLDKSAYTGENITFSGETLENHHIVTLQFSKDEGTTWSDITSSLDRDKGTFKYIWNSGIGGPTPPGKYSVIIRTINIDHTTSQTPPIDVIIKPAKEFKNQIIFQDDRNSPLPKSSWILGPFNIPREERFLGITTSSNDHEFDLDLFLFQDKNLNRKLDGMDELLSKSTTSTPDEKIIVNDSLTGVYWIYCQGWQVKERMDIAEKQIAPALLPPGAFLNLKLDDFQNKTTYALADINLSFNYQHTFIIDVEPTENTPADEVIIKGGFDPAFNVDISTVQIFINGKNMTSISEINEQHFKMSLENIFEDSVYRVRVEAKTDGGLSDCVEWEFRAIHKLVDLTSTPEDGEKSVSVQVVCRKNNKLEKARARFSNIISKETSEWFDIKIAGDSTTASGHLITSGHSEGAYEVLLEFKLKGLATDTVMSSFKLGKSAILSKELIIYPADKINIYDFQPMLACFAVGEACNKVKSMKLVLDGTDITNKCKIYDSAIRFLPNSNLNLGEHTLNCKMVLQDGSSIEGKSTFIIKVMNELLIGKY